MLKRRDAVVTVGLFALVVVFFHNALLGGEQFFAGDTFRYFYPLKKMTAEAVRNWQAPVWNPLVHSGMPLYAALQAAVFYPFSLLFYLFPFDFAYKWYVALHVFLAAAGTYALLRRWKLKVFAAAFGGITYAFSGYVISFIDGLNIFSSIVWLPIIFLLFERAVEEPRIFNVILAAFAITAQTLAGDPVSGYYTFLICGIYWLILLAKYSFQRRPRLEMGARLLVLPAVALFGLLLAYAQVGPSQEMTHYSTRAAGIGYESAAWHSLAPMRLLTLAAPYVFGNPVQNLFDWGALFAPHFPLERTLYIGMMPLVLLPLSILVYKERRVYFFAGVFFISLVLALGKYTPLYRFAYTMLPLFNKFRYPLKAFFLVSFSAAILSGYGVHYLISQENRVAQALKTKAGSVTRRYSQILIVVGLSLLAISLCDRYLIDLSGGILLRAASSGQAVVQSIIPQMKDQFVRASLLLSLAGVIVWMRQRKLLSPLVFRYLALGFLLLDLLPSSYQLIDTVPDSFYSAPRVDSILRAEDSLFRLYRSPLNVEQNISGLGFKDTAEYQLWNRELLSPNFGTLFGYAYTDGYESANLLWHNLFIKFVESSPPLLRPRLLGLVNVKYIFSSHPLRHPDLRLRISLDERTFLYENRRCLNRAYFVPVSITASTEAVALRVLASNIFDPSMAVVLDDEGGPGSLSPQSGADQFAVAVPPDMKFTSMDIGDIPENAASAPEPDERSRGNEVPVTLRQYSPNHIVLTVNAPTDGYVVLCDSYYPRWKATVNGRSADILRANCTVRAVAVPYGDSTIEFIYDTTLFKRDAMVSLLAAVFCICLALFDWRRYRSQNDSRARN